MQEEKGKKFGEKVLDSINLPAQLVAFVTKTRKNERGYVPSEHAMCLRSM